MDKQKILEFLQTVESLKDVLEGSLVNIAGVVKEVTYTEGELIIRQGDRGDTFYILLNGSADVTRTLQDVIQFL